MHEPTIDRVDGDEEIVYTVVHPAEQGQAATVTITVHKSEPLAYDMSVVYHRPPPDHPQDWQALVAELDKGL